VALETFTWQHLVGPEGTFKHATLKAQFGDGYVQLAADGINNRQQEWPLVFRGKAPKIEPIKAFLDRHGGHKPFTWTPPLGAAGSYVVKDGYQLATISGHGSERLFTLTVTFSTFNSA
jgi:phage-related protein